MGISTFFYIASFIDNYNITRRRILVVCMDTDNVTGVDGNGVLATITFNSTSNDGLESQHLADVKLSDPDPTPIPCVTVDGEVTVLPEFPTALVLPLLMIMSCMTIILRKKIVNHRGVFHTA